MTEECSTHEIFTTHFYGMMDALQLMYELSPKIIDLVFFAQYLSPPVRINEYIRK